MITAQNAGRELACILRETLGEAAMPDVDLRLWALPYEQWAISATCEGQRAGERCLSSSLTLPLDEFAAVYLFTMAADLAAKIRKARTAHIRSGLDPYYPGKVAAIRMEQPAPKLHDARKTRFLAVDWSSEADSWRYAEGMKGLDAAAERMRRQSAAMQAGEPPPDRNAYNPFRGILWGVLIATGLWALAAWAVHHLEH